jgi:hypothetical protein
VPAKAAYTGHVLTHANGPIMNPRTHEVELSVVAETQAEVPRIGRRSPAGPTEPSGTVQPEREGARAAEERSKPRACAEPGAESFLFDDPYWDDAFDSYHNPTLRTCCRS